MMSHPKPDLTAHAFSYQGAFSLLTSDLKTVCEYVEPTDDNRAVYSHRTYELLLRACTEWESLCKEALVASGDTTLPDKMNVRDYVRLEPILRLETVEVELLFWRPSRVRVLPYGSWTSATPPLGWYERYNLVKHNRNAKFGAASFENVCMALSALYALHNQLGLIPSPASAYMDKGRTQTWHHDQVFSCITFDEKP